MLAEAGYTDEADLKRISDIVAKQHVSFEVVSIDPAMLARSNCGCMPGQIAVPRTSPEAGESREAQGLKKIVLFRPIADDPRIRMNAMGSQEDVHDLDEGLDVGGGGAGQSLDLLSDLDLRGRRALSPRATLRPHVSAGERRAVPGGGVDGLLLRLQARCWPSCSVSTA